MPKLLSVQLTDALEWLRAHIQGLRQNNQCLSQQIKMKMEKNTFQ